MLGEFAGVPIAPFAKWILIEVADGKRRYTQLVPRTEETEKLKIPDPTRWHYP